jgi:hypothetical protein
MTDRELLELAAKAAGHNFNWRGYTETIPTIGLGMYQSSWNPLTDDGDALRLAVKLKLFGDNFETYNRLYGEISSDIEIHERCRLAIVRAAAEIGKSMC